MTDFIVEPVPRKTISSFIEKYHYSHSINGVQHIQCFALFREGKPVFMMHRYQIENCEADEIAGSLKKAFDEHCIGQVA